MKEYILILSSVYDFSVDLVIQRLEKAKHNYIRLNKEHFNFYELTLNPIDKTLTINGNGLCVCLSSIKSIWYRQPVFLRNTPGKTIDITDQLSKSQWNAFIRGLMVFDDAFWLNWPQSTYAAESKPYQLMLAKKMGFPVPQTIISNSLGFKHLRSEKFIIKSLDTVLLRENNDCYFTYTSNATPKDFSLNNTKDAPITFQEYVEDKLDIRVTVIRDKVFSVSITKNGSPINDDWRTTEKTHLEYNDIQLPDVVNEMCIFYVKALGLNYGAIDLIKSHNQFVFIEINPTGEWGWLANKERQIDEEIANALILGEN